MQLKRLWDTEGKKIVFAEGPSGHMCQVWTDETGDHLYIYDKSQWLSYNGTSPAGMEYDRSNWVELVDQEVGFYDTNEPTDLYSWDSGDKASYKFVDWDGTVLKSGVVEEGETPTAPADPTRAATAQYTYTFAGWNPTVGPISKKTLYTATYTATVNEYTITWVDGDGNTLDTDTLEYGATPVYEGETPTKTATAQYTYTWDEGWTPSVVAVTGDATYTATFTATVNQYTVTIQSNNTDYGTVDESSVTVDYGTAISASNNVLTIGETTITATAETGYDFSSWTVNGGALPSTVTGDITVLATFELPTPIAVQSISNITLPLGDLIVGEGGSTTFTFDYLPVNANDFSNVTFMESDECYDTPRTSASITSYSNGTATVTVQGLAYTTTNNPELEIYLNSVQQGDDKTMQVRPYGEVQIIPSGGGTVTLSKPLYIPYGGTLYVDDSDYTTTNPATVEIRGDDTVVDTLTITATPEDGYDFEEFVSKIASDGYDPETRRNVITCSFVS